MRTRHAAPVIAVAFSFVMLTLGSSSADVRQPQPSSSGEGGGLVIAHQPAPSAVPAVTDDGKPPDKNPVPAPTATTQRTNPTTPESKAVDIVAEQLNGRAFERALDEPSLTLDSPSDAYPLAVSYWESSSILWGELVDRLRLKAGPLTFRPLVYNELFEDQDTTGCDYLNRGKRTVKSDSPAPFFCLADGTAGQLHWPVKGMEQRWATTELTDGVVIRGTAIWLNQLYGQYVAFAVYNTHAGMLGAERLIQPMYDMLGEVSMCFAGAAMQANFLDREALLDGLAFVPADAGERKKYKAALAYGFDRNDLGKCVAEYWPRTV